MEIIYRPIGIIHTDFKTAKDAPRGPGIFQPQATGRVEVYPEYTKGLKDIEGFSHLIIIYHFHLSKGYNLVCKPFIGDVKRGVFATRAPKRPNPIGISVVRLLERKENTLVISEVDMVDKTPLLDLKPYVPQVDTKSNVSVGWIEKAFKRGEV
ncbi:MAG: tRNA (N6-threonylcarbamoyladenosine(37)-N6)-methyltransferase TrmO [Planctomycetes bacterium]|nr:tRNA (N6-threonylcarbamoyladenosine(37)-N6)-methyltransferase TrmO [Planctomycetota bacterium]